MGEYAEEKRGKGGGESEERGRDKRSGGRERMRGGRKGTKGTRTKLTRRRETNGRDELECENGRRGGRAPNGEKRAKRRGEEEKRRR